MKKKGFILNAVFIFSTNTNNSHICLHTRSVCNTFFQFHYGCFFPGIFPFLADIQHINIVPISFFSSLPWHTVRKVSTTCDNKSILYVTSKCSRKARLFPAFSVYG